MTSKQVLYEDIKTKTLRLLDYCRKNAWAGYDPFDALNSKLFSSLPIFNRRVPRLVFTQLMKRSPLNLREMLRVPKTLNPKAIALFLMAFVKLSELGLLDDKELINNMVENLKDLRDNDATHRCWGYSFPWQTRKSIVPRGSPNLICTVFVANALLNIYNKNHDPGCLCMAIDASEYILRDLYWANGNGLAGFSYPLPSTRAHIHNANFLGAAFLCRMFHLTGESKFMLPALKVARFSASKQNVDGSWFYGELPKTKWIDNFHTGYNLMALRDIKIYLETDEFDAAIIRGLNFFKNNFIKEDGAVKYFHNKTYPIDIHCVAQTIITLLTFKGLDSEHLQATVNILKWTIRHMWDERGYFYYRAYPIYTNRISYIRWSQAWMLLALSNVLEELPKVE
jgi:hypothetical protein